MAATTQDCIMLFGDSITQAGWTEGAFGAKLMNDYSRKLDVLNRGFAGYNTDWALGVFDKIYAKTEERAHIPKVRLLVIWFGANDACIKGSPQHVPITKFISNLKHLVNLLQSPKSEYYSPETKIILITPPPVNTIQWGAFCKTREPPQELDRLFETTKEYAEAVKTAASEEEVVSVDVWTALWEAAGQQESNLDKFMTDGLHLTEEGYMVVYNTLLSTIKEAYPELDPEAMEYVHPRWNELCGINL